MTESNQFPPEQVRPISVQVLPAQGGLPEVLLCPTASEQLHPGSKSFLSYIAREGGRDEVSAPSLCASAYRVASRWERLLLVQAPQQQIALRICNALRNCAVRTFLITFRLGLCK
jgi:hypothetical protein